jgi:hypothetical protein
MAASNSKKEMPKTPTEYQYCTVIDFDEHTVALVAPDMESLRAAWIRVAISKKTLDPALVQRVRIEHDPVEPPAKKWTSLKGKQ